MVFGPLGITNHWHFYAMLIQHAVLMSTEFSGSNVKGGIGSI